MIRVSLKAIIRRVLREKAHTAIHLIGLTLGMISCILIYFWIANQQEYDKAQRSGDHVYRIEVPGWVNMPSIIANLAGELPEVKQTARLHTFAKPIVRADNYLGKINDFVYADASALKVFKFEFLQGDPESALVAPFNIILTESTSKLIFGSQDPLNKQLLLDNTHSFRVTGVIRDVDHFHVSTNAIASITSLSKISGYKNFLNSNNEWNYTTYAILKEGTNIDRVESKLSNHIHQRLPEFEDEIILRHYDEIYYATDTQHEGNIKHGNYQLIILFAAIAISILLLSFVNFINLSTARISVRSKSISISKVMGASRLLLVGQFFMETAIYIASSIVLALVLVWMIGSNFSSLFGEQLVINYFQYDVMIGIGGLLIFGTLIAGIYPALSLSSFNELNVKSALNWFTGKTSVRRALVIFQVSTSMILVAFSVLIIRQINYVRTAELGINIDQIINVQLPKENLEQDKKLFREALLNNPDIKGISYSGAVPGTITNTNEWTVNEVKKSMKVFQTDPDFLGLMDLQILQGRDLSWNLETDKFHKYVINETALKYLELEFEPGLKITRGAGDGEIIGVVKDFHFNSLHHKIEPLAIQWNPRWNNIANVKINGKNTTSVLEHISATCGELFPEYPYDYSFLDSTFEALYTREQKIANLIAWFSIIALVIAGLGIYGLIQFITEQKIKEIGIRKVLGASVGSLLKLFTINISKWLIIGFVIAMPIAYMVMNDWLQNFAYKVQISGWMFLFAGVLVSLIALVTVSAQVLKSVRINPVETLKQE